MARRQRPTPYDLIATCDALVAKLTTTSIAQYGYYRGHPVVCLEGEACERYANDLTSTVSDAGVAVERPCVSCGLLAAPDGPDPCLGMLPDVVSACCGHGVEEPYLKFHGRHGLDADLTGDAAREYFKHHGGGPPYGSVPAAAEERKNRKEGPMNIFVGNLAFTTTEDEVRQVFETYGEVERVQLLVDRETGRARGFGFVEMPDAAQARAAIAGLNGTNLGGRSLTVNEARQREERGGSGPRRPRG